jgi:hypothetical protein
MGGGSSAGKPAPAIKSAVGGGMMGSSYLDQVGSGSVPAASSPSPATTDLTVEEQDKAIEAKVEELVEKLAEKAAEQAAENAAENGFDEQN